MTSARARAMMTVASVPFALLFPLRCVACDERDATAARCGVCDRCLAAIRPCTYEPAPFLGAPITSCVAYRGPAAHLVLAAKRTGHHGVLSCMAGLLASHVPAGAVLTWAPTSPERRRARGYDHGELLARRTAALAGAPVVGLLERTSSAQHGRTAAQRATVAFRLRGDAHRRFAHACRRVGGDASLVVIDDVRTTGATVRAAIAGLRDLSATQIVALTYAAADRPG
jgi:predicted amidophosphoribosyltransferase